MPFGSETGRRDEGEFSLMHQQMAESVRGKPEGGNIRKNIEEVCICMDFSGEADIILNDADTEYKQTIFSAQKSSSPIKLMPHFKGVYGVSISVSAKSPISFKGIYIKYKNLI